MEGDSLPIENIPRVAFGDSTLAPENLPESSPGAGGIGWSFGSHVGETTTQGISIWPGPECGQRQATVPSNTARNSRKMRRSSSRACGHDRDIERRMRHVPDARSQQPFPYCPAYAQVLDGSISGDWFAESVREEWLRAGRSRDGRTPRLLQPATPQGWLHDEQLPLPPLQTVYEIERECRSLPSGEFGPLGKAWLEEVLRWAQRMKDKYQQGRTRVTGSWRLNLEHWRGVGDPLRRHGLSLCCGATHP